MKAIRRVFIPLILIICVAVGLLAASCVNNRLDTPSDISINLDNYLLSWSRVDNARGYQIEVTHDPEEDGDPEIYSVGSTKISYSLQVLAEGDYIIRVRATAGSSRTYSDSLWSDYISLNKDYYSGCAFSLVNNATAYEVTGWTKPADGLTDIVIPDVYRDKPVIGIAANAFKSKTSLTSVEVTGDNLQYIGKNAFYSCTKLESVTLPDSVTEIGEGAFHSCRILETFDMPKGVTEIEDSTFLYCRGLESVNFGEAEIESIGASAFMGCNENLTEITIPDTVTSIGEKAFAECSVLESVVIGTGLESVTDYAFQNCKALKTVVFAEDGDAGSSVKEIGEYAFSGCTALCDITLPYGLETIGESAFNRNSALEDINIPETVKKIGVSAFDSTPIIESQEDDVLVYVGLEAAKEKNSQNRSWIVGYNETALTENDCLNDDGEYTGYYRLLSKNLEDSLIGIADYAFNKETSINEGWLPGRVQYIGDYAFDGCSRVTTFIIEGSTTSPEDVYIGSYAFANMTSLSNFRFVLYDGVSTSGVKEVGDHAFYGDKTLTTIEIPASVEKIGGYAFRNSGIASSGLDSSTNVIYAGTASSTSYMWAVGYDGYTSGSVELKDNTRGIADYAFTRDTYLSTVTNMSNVSYIGEGAFYKCSNLTEVSVPRFVTAINDYTFYGCSSLVSLGSSVSGGTLGQYITSIGRSAFYNCAKLSNLSLASSPVGYIGKYAFYHCDSLEELNLGTYLEEIDDYAFYKSGLKTVSFPDTLQRVGEKAFYKCESLESIDFGSGNENLELSRYAFYKCTKLESVSVPGNVKEVGEYAFYKCDKVENLKLGDGVERIDAGAFAGLAITSLHIPSSVKYIGNYAFKSCKNLTSVIIPTSVEVIGGNAFYGVTSATFYTNATEYLPQWDMKLNSSYSPFVWGCTLSDDGTYVVSVQIFAGSVENVIRIEGNEEPEESETADTENGEDEEEEKKGQVNYSRLCDPPERDGYTFLGWALTEGGLPVYSADVIDTVYGEVGEVTLYAVWEKN